MIDKKTIDRLCGCLIGFAIGDHFNINKTKNNLTKKNFAICNSLSETSSTGQNSLDCVRSALTNNSIGQILPPDQIYPQVVDAEALFRCAPIAIYSFLSELNFQGTASLAYLSARLTHNSPISTYPAVGLVMLLYSAFFDDKKMPSLSECGLWCGHSVIKDPASDVLHYTCVEGYKSLHYEDLDIIAGDSGLWALRHIMEKCLGFPILQRMSICDNIEHPWVNIPTFETGIQNTIDRSTDFPNLTCVAGAILGAYWGESGIPKKYKAMTKFTKSAVDVVNRMIGKCVPQRQEDRLAEIENLPIQERFTYDGKLFLKTSLKSEYEAMNHINSEKGWHLITQEHASLINRGDLIRSFKRPYRAPNEILMYEYKVRSKEYKWVNAYYRSKGWQFPVIDLYENGRVQINTLFENAEVWIKREY